MQQSKKRRVVLVAGNQVISEGAVLLRNIVLARLLGPEEMGIVVMLAMMLRLLEMLSYLAADRLLVQARDGYTYKFLSNAHGLELIRGLLSGIVLAVLASPAATLFGYPDTAWAFTLLGLVPLIRGFTHLDYRRKQRWGRFGDTFKAESTAHLAATAAVWPITLVVSDYSAIVWISLVHAAALVLVSHAVAAHRYAIRVDLAHLRRIFEFGWPLVINSLVMFGVFQGDKFIVAMAAAAEDLSRYALALQLGLLPTMVLARCCLTLMLPALSRCQDDRDKFGKIYGQIFNLLSLAAGVFVFVFVLFGNLLLEGLFGPAYLVPSSVLLWLGIAMGLRILRIAPNTAHLAFGDSRSLMVANLWRLSGLAIAAVAAFFGFGLTAIAAAASLGELVAACVGLHLLSKLRGMRIHLPALTGTFVLFFMTAGWSLGLLGTSPKLSTVITILITLTIIGAVTLFVFLRNTRSPQHEAIP